MYDSAKQEIALLRSELEAARDTIRRQRAQLAALQEAARPFAQRAKFLNAPFYTDVMAVENYLRLARALEESEKQP